MKAIVMAPQNSLYKKYNGLTFHVVKVLNNGLFCLDINSVHTDFSSHELLIVDFEKEFQSAFDARNWGSIGCAFDTLDKYRTDRNIDIEPQYNCPA